MYWMLFGMKCNFKIAIFISTLETMWLSFSLILGSAFFHVVCVAFCRAELKGWSALGVASCDSSDEQAGKRLSRSNYLHIHNNNGTFNGSLSKCFFIVLENEHIPLVLSWLQICLTPIWLLLVLSACCCNSKIRNETAKQFNLISQKLARSGAPFCSPSRFFLCLCICFGD